MLAATSPPNSSTVAGSTARKDFVTKLIPPRASLRQRYDIFIK
jgi:hypothetical protein